MQICPDNGICLNSSINCGQAFRWKSYQNGFMGVVNGKALYIQQEDDMLKLDCDQEDILSWQKYFSLEENPSQMENLLSQDEVTSGCLEYSRGIRIFHQQPFEALISFIISANNNIKRIGGIIDRICQNYGNKISYRKNTLYTFPTVDQLSKTTYDELKDIGVGYRANYILHTLKMLNQGSLLDELKNKNFDEVKQSLQKFPGVGPKVAECIMLFSLGFGEACPMDVWMKRVVRKIFPNINDEKEALSALRRRFGNQSGLAQQYLFYYARETGWAKE